MSAVNPQALRAGEDLTRTPTSGSMSPQGWAAYTANADKIYQQFMQQALALGMDRNSASLWAQQQFRNWGQSQHDQMYSDANAAPLGIKELAPIAGNNGLNAPLAILGAGSAATGLAGGFSSAAPGAPAAPIAAGANSAPTLLADAGTSMTDVAPGLDASGAPAAGPGSYGQPYDMGQVTVSAPANTAPIQTLSNTPISSITGIAPGSTLAGAEPSLFPMNLGAPDVAIPELSGADLGAINGATPSSVAAGGGSSSLVGGAGVAAAAGAGGSAAANGVAGAPAPAPAPSAPQDIQMGPNTPTTTGGGYTVDPNTGNVTGGAAGSAAAGAGSAFSRILDGTATNADWAGILGMGGATALSAYGANQQANTLKGMYDTYLGLGAPSRSRYEASFQPGFDITQDPGLKSAMESSTDALMRRASVGGNPAGNPSVLAEIQKYTTGNVALPYLQQYRGQNASTGGYGAYNASAPATGGAAVGAAGNVYSDIGRGAANIFSPQPTLQQFFQQMKGLT